jgi:hypothetical protein
MEKDATSTKTHCILPTRKYNINKTSNLWNFIMHQIIEKKMTVTIEIVT